MKRTIRANRTGAADGAYLTRQILIRSARRAGKIAEANAMQAMGYIIVAEDGWIVRKNADGSMHKIQKLKHRNVRKSYSLG